MTVLALAWRCVHANWKLKLFLSIALTLGFCVPYFALQRLPLLPPQRLPASVIDRAISFAPAWVWMYQSVYLLLSLVPWLVPSAGQLKRYAVGFVLQSIVGFTCFLLYPIEGPRPTVLPDDWMFQALVWYDAPLNSLPSLHVGLSVYTVLFAARASRGRIPTHARRGALLLLGVWAAAIAFAAVATKQHYAVDLVAGALLAWLCHRWSWRGLSAVTFEQQRSANAESIGSVRRSPDFDAGWCLAFRGRTAAGDVERSGRSGS